MAIRDGVVDAIGDTPLIRLRRASEATGCTILGKAEFMNPGQSVKDRPAKQMILEAEKRGDLKPGGLVVEATAGNTGIGLALVASARGYRSLIVIPNTQSQEKKDTLRLCGAELIEVPAVPYANPNNYQHVGRRLADELRKKEPNGVLFADQWNNLDNRKAHYVSTGPEIWSRPAARSTVSSARSAPAAHLRRVELPARAEARRRDRRCRSERCSDVQLVHPLRGQGDRGRLGHRRHRARPRDARHRGPQD
jgi:cysteine synthase A